MLWFKHDSDAGNDAKLRKVRLKYGATGYGIYWYCLELIARNVDKNNLTFELEHDAELIAEDFRLSPELVQEMMTYMVNLGLFENAQGVITCLKMSNRTDEYTHKLINKSKKCPDNIPTISVDNPEKSALIEEKRREENRKDIHRGCRLSKDWVLPIEWLDEAININSSLTKNQINYIADGFRDYWIGLPGAKSVKRDWLATWRNWIRNQKNPQSEKSQVNQSSNGVVI